MHRFNRMHSGFAVGATSSRRSSWFLFLFFAIFSGVWSYAGMIQNQENTPVTREQLVGVWRTVAFRDILGLPNPAHDQVGRPVYRVYHDNNTMHEIYLNFAGRGDSRNFVRDYDLSPDGLLLDMGDRNVAEPRQAWIKDDVLIVRHLVGSVFFYRRVDRVAESIGDVETLAAQSRLFEHFEPDRYFDRANYAHLTTSVVDATKASALEALRGPWGAAPSRGHRVTTRAAGEEGLVPVMVEISGKQMREVLVPAGAEDDVAYSAGVESGTLLDAHRIMLDRGYRLLSCVEAPNYDKQPRSFCAVWVPNQAWERYRAELEQLGVSVAVIELPEQLQWK